MEPQTEDIGNQDNAGAVTIIYNSKKGLDKGQLKRQFWHQNSPGIVNYAEAGDRFGHALAVGDFNGDSCDDLAVGAPGESHSTSNITWRGPRSVRIRHRGSWPRGVNTSPLDNTVTPVTQFGARPRSWNHLGPGHDR